MQLTLNLCKNIRVHGYWLINTLHFRIHTHPYSVPGRCIGTYIAKITEVDTFSYWYSLNQFNIFQCNHSNLEPLQQWSKDCNSYSVRLYTLHDAVDRLLSLWLLQPLQKVVCAWHDGFAILSCGFIIMCANCTRKKMDTTHDRMMSWSSCHIGSKYNVCIFLK